MSKNYKDTLLMPKTSFEMRGNLPMKDSFFNDFWEKRNILDKLKDRKKTFILHDGPPYANGNIHLGHALNKILKDIIIRNKILNGFNVDWRIGWDTHGLPIEWELQKKRILLKDIGIEQYLKKCRNFAINQSEKQEKQFKSLSIIGDFKNKYLTLDNNVEAAEIKIFNKMLNDGLAYQDLKPIYWSWSSQSSLAEAEIEYKDVESNSIYVNFKLKDEDLNILIWTTTPWTLPANKGLAFGKKINYSIVEINEIKTIVANDLIEKIEKETEEKINVLNDFDPSTLIGKYAINPLNGDSSKIVWGHHVTTEGGTGIVHIAGGHGHDDYLISLEHNLPLKVVVDERGIQINSDKYDGEFYLKNNEKIIDDLLKNNSLIFNSKFTHSHPIDWRTKKQVFYRATKQWFVSISKIKDGLLKEIDNVEWIPSWGKERLKKMTESRQDWCVSRQRSWGVPLPIIYDENNKPIINTELQENIEKLFEKKGSYGFISEDIKNILPDSIPYNDKMRKESDILDVWFDSGSIHYAQTPGVQSDIYVEGIDQFRGWFNSSLITSYVKNGFSPYKKVLAHGFVTDGNGNKMSKSIGNVIDPLEIVKNNGSDILRLWVSQSDFTDNIKITKEIIDQNIKDYRKIRNTIKFLLGNLFDYKEEKIVLSKFNNSVYNHVSKIYNDVKLSFDLYNFNSVIKMILNELSSGAISHFIDYSKDIIYVRKKDSAERKEIQYVFNHILKVLYYSLAPIIPVTIEEAFNIDNDISIFETTFDIEKDYSSDGWKEINDLKTLINKEIEKLREDKIISRSQEVEIDLSIPKENFDWDIENLNEVFMVAKINVIYNEKLFAKAKKFNGKKCERCWKHFKELNNENICKNCLDFLN